MKKYYRLDKISTRLLTRGSWGWRLDLSRSFYLYLRLVNKSLTVGRLEDLSLLRLLYDDPVCALKRRIELQIIMITWLLLVFM